jgi:hypothetical protein
MMAKVAKKVNDVCQPDATAGTDAIYRSMKGDDIAVGRVVAVLLADGWHRIVPGSFWVGRMSFDAGTDPGTPGFRFEEADAGRPYQPTVLAGPLDSIIAVRQVAPAVEAGIWGGLTEDERRRLHRRLRPAGDSLSEERS